MLGQDLAAGFDIAAGLVFGTAGFDLKKTAEPPSAHFFEANFSYLGYKMFTFEKLNSLSDLWEQINAKKTSGLIISETQEAFKTRLL